MTPAEAQQLLIQRAESLRRLSHMDLLDLFELCSQLDSTLAADRLHILRGEVLQRMSQAPNPPIEER